MLVTFPYHHLYYAVYFISKQLKTRNKQRTLVSDDNEAEKSKSAQPFRIINELGTHTYTHIHIVYMQLNLITHGS